MIGIFFIDNEKNNEASFQIVKYNKKRNTYEVSLKDGDICNHILSLETTKKNAKVYIENFINKLETDFEETVQKIEKKE